MLRTLSRFSATVLLSAIASAQCLTVTGAPIVLSNPDDALSAVLPMGISFPMAGAVGGPFTHCVVSTNGVVYLTTGGAATNASATAYGSVAQLQGTAGASPRVAPYWGDLWDALYPGVAWSVNLDTSVAGRCAITWKDTCEWPLDTPPVDFQVELFDTGVVTFNYGNIDTSLFADDALVGVSIGNGIADPGASDLSAGPNSTTGILYELLLPGAFDLANTGISFFPNGTGYTVVTVCSQPPASHTPFGAGCYTVSDSLYELHADAAAAAAALTGQSLVLTAAGNQYVAVWGGGTFVPPSGAATALTAFVPNNDDGVQTVTLPSPLPIPGGTTSTLVVHNNGNVWAGDNYPSLLIDYDPFVPELLAASNTGWWSWHDYNALEAGSGQIKVEHVGSTTHITWDNVENYPAGTVNLSTVQFQFDRATGGVTIVWQCVDANATSAFGSAHLVGYSPGGASADGGSLALATALPLVTTVNMFPMSLSATPAPVSTPSAGTLVTYTTDAMPEAAPGSGLYVGLTFFSFGQVPAPGLDLALLGAPGCFAHVASLDLLLTLIGTTPTQSVNFNVPAGIATGTTIYAQSAALVVPGSLPNGQNPFGLTTSSAIATFIAAY